MWWIDSCACVAVKTLGALLRLLPVEWALWVGRCFGDVMCLAKPARARLAAVNVAWAFGPRYTPAERRRIVRESFRTLGQSVVEFLRLPLMDARYVDRYIPVNGLERIDAAIARGRGMIFLTGHFGNWELSSIVGAIKGYPMVALAREQKFPRLYQLLNSYREAKGCRVVGKGMALRVMVRELKANRIVGIVGDQGAKTQGIRVTLFGRDALTPPGPVELGLRTGAVVLPAFIRRTRGASHVIDVEPPLDLTARAGETAEAVVQRGLQTFMDRLAAHISEAPGQWLWMHRRWKSTLLRHALVISDGKAGHIKQSLAVIEALRVKYPSLTHEVIETAFRSPAHRWLVTLSTWMPVLPARWFLPSKISVAHPCDFVISCGASTAPINVLAAREHLAKSIVIMRPSLVPLRAFTLAMIPAHDHPPQRANVVRTAGALHAVTEERLAAAQQRLAARYGFAAANLPAAPAAAAQAGGWRIGVLLGGDTEDTQLTPQRVGQLLDQLEALCRAWPAELLVTTSRRTAPSVEQLCADRLQQRPHCPLLVLANRANADGVVEGILGASHVVVVSGESSSMVSEAIASGRPVVIIEPEPQPHRRVDRKRRRLLETLATRPGVRVTSYDRVGASVSAVAAQPQQPAVSEWRALCDAVSRL